MATLKQYAHSGKYTDEQRALRQAAKRRWMDKNPEKVREYQKSRKEYRKLWSLRNPEKTKEYSKKWREENREKTVQNAISWQRKNPDKVKQIDFKRHSKRRGRILFSLSPSHDKKVEMELIVKRQELSRTTGVAWCIDHIIPLSHGGVHHHDNLQLLPMSVNSRKSANPFWRVDGYKTWAEVDPALWPDKLKNRYLKILREESNCLS